MSKVNGNKTNTTKKIANKAQSVTTNQTKNDYTALKEEITKDKQEKLALLNEIKDTLTKVVKSHEQIRKQNKQALQELVKEILVKEVKEMLPEIIKSVIEELNVTKNTV